MTTDIRAALARADQRYSKRAGYDEPLAAEHLDALTAAIQPFTAPDTELSRIVAQQQGQIRSLEIERDQLAEQLRETRADTQRRVDAAVRATETTVKALREQIDNLRIDLAAATTATAEPEHHHAYEWLGPGTDPLPCECGHPYPRTALYEELADGEEVEPDLEPFDDLMARVRTDLADWNPAPHLTVATERCDTQEVIRGA